MKRAPRGSMGRESRKKWATKGDDYVFFNRLMINNIYG